MATSFRASLEARYGPIVDAKTICKLLYFPNVTALKHARARGKLGFRVVQLEARRGVFARTEDVAAYLERAFDSEAEPPDLKNSEEAHMLFK